MINSGIFILYFVHTGSNILIKKKCCCFDIFKCECRRKCIVKLSDFDSVKQFKKNEFMRQYFEWNPYVCMSPDECEKVMGTPGYRAPEVRNSCTYM